MKDTEGYYVVTINRHGTEGPQPESTVTTTFPVTYLRTDDKEPPESWALARAIEEAVESMPPRGVYHNPSEVFILLGRWEQRKIERDAERVV